MTCWRCQGFVDPVQATMWSIFPLAALNEAAEETCSNAHTPGRTHPRSLYSGKQVPVRRRHLWRGGEGNVGKAAQGRSAAVQPAFPSRQPPAIRPTMCNDHAHSTAAPHQMAFRMRACCNPFTRHVPTPSHATAPYSPAGRRPVPWRRGGPLWRCTGRRACHWPRRRWYGRDRKKLGNRL